MTLENNKSVSQNGEDLFVLNYFGDYKGTLLDIGANDGITFSNSRLLIENGWKAALIEPSSIGKQLKKLYKNNKNVKVYNFGIGEKNEVVEFWESGEHVKGGSDRALVSSTYFEETKRWADVQFEKKLIRLESWEHFYNGIGCPKLDFISIDAEGYDWKILQQIDLEKVGCKVLCIEWNSKPELKELFTEYCSGYDIAVENAENLVFVKKEFPVLKKEEKKELSKPIKIGVGLTNTPTDKSVTGNKWPGGEFLPEFCDDSFYFACNSVNSTIAKDKNWCIKELYDHACDYFFIFDDDTFPIKKGWEQFFINESIRTGVQHFIVANDRHNQIIDFDNALLHFQKGTGCMLFLTRKVIEQVGYMNNKYGKYGYEHAAYSARIHKAGLTPAWYVSPEGWEKYIYAWDLDKESANKHNFVKEHQFTEEEKKKYIAENEFEFRREMRSKQIYYDYEQAEPQKRKRKVAYLSIVDDGSNYYRIQGVLKFIDHELLQLTDISHLNLTSWATYAGFDILIMPRPWDQLSSDIIGMAKMMGLWVICDYDDDVFNVPDHHSFYDEYQNNRANIESCVHQADEIWVTTEPIRESLYPLNHNIHVIPNAHNDFLFPVEQKKKFSHDNREVCYRGGNTHRVDLFYETKTLVSIAKENPEWKFIYIGVIENKEFAEANRKNSNVYVTSKIPVIQYITHINNLNAPIMICPLEDNKLNHAKSNIAWLEGTYAGSCFFGNKKIKSFDMGFILPFSLLSKAISEEHFTTMRDCNEASWEYICENLLLSKINLLRIERLLA